MTRALNVGIVGATGMVGEVFLQLLEKRDFPVGALKLFASQRSQGHTRRFKGQNVSIDPLSADGFKGLDVVFFSSGDDISKEWAPLAVEAGAVAIDNSAAFRMAENTPLVVPEVNGDILPGPGVPMLIANPNCSTIQLVMTLNPLRRDFGLESVHVATYQSVSGAGKAGQEELSDQLIQWSTGTPIDSPETFPHPIAMNAIPQIGSFSANGFCSEEIKIMKESKKILRDSSFRLSAFTVRIPAWNSHSEAVWIRLKTPVTKEKLLASLKSQSGLVIEDDPDNSVYPLAKIYDGKDPVAVGRVHQDLDDPQTWLMWVVADNLRKGAALNGIQIAERIFDITPRS
ncbi:MAG TPA: aspartate-semialdehyde dehydrogenase [Bdellovibrionales bacterium]|nr:aspartate-semialdehyde dehydrogenase [Bdellovibrionales bacterium]